MSREKRDWRAGNNLNRFPKGSTRAIFELALLNPAYWNRLDKKENEERCRRYGKDEIVNYVFPFRFSPITESLIRGEIRDLVSPILKRVKQVVQDAKRSTITEDDLRYVIANDSVDHSYMKLLPESYAELIGSKAGRSLPRLYPMEAVRGYMLELLHGHGSSATWRVSENAVRYMKFAIESRLFFIAQTAVQIAEVANLQTVQRNHVAIAANVLRRLEGRGRVHEPHFPRNVTSKTWVCTTTTLKRKKKSPRVSHGSPRESPAFGRFLNMSLGSESEGEEYQPSRPSSLQPQRAYPLRSRQ